MNTDGRGEEPIPLVDHGVSRHWGLGVVLSIPGPVIKNVRSRANRAGAGYS